MRRDRAHRRRRIYCEKVLERMPITGSIRSRSTLQNWRVYIVVAIVVRPFWGSSRRLRTRGALKTSGLSDAIEGGRAMDTASNEAHGTDCYVEEGTVATTRRPVYIGTGDHIFSPEALRVAPFAGARARIAMRRHLDAKVVLSVRA